MAPAKDSSLPRGKKTMDRKTIYENAEKAFGMLWIFWGWVLWMHPGVVESVQMLVLGILLVYGPQISSFLVTTLDKRGLWPIPHLDKVMRGLLIALLAAMVYYMKAGQWIFLASIIGATIAHEFGHWIAARWAGIPVPVFSIGLDPELNGLPYFPVLRWTFMERWGTKFQATPYLVGGFNQIDPDGEAFKQAAWWKKVGVLAAGPAMNLIVAVVIMFGSYTALGQPEWSARIHSFPTEDSVAARAGIQKGDTVIAIDGVPVHLRNDVITLVRKHTPGTAMKVTTKRGSFDVVPRGGKLEVLLVDVMGASSSKAKYDPAQTFVISVGAVDKMYGQVWQGMGMMVGYLPAPQNTDVRLHSLVDTTRVGGQLYEEHLFSFLWLLAFVNVSIFFFNALPCGYLDGGYITLILYEKAVGRPLPPKVHNAIFWVSARFLIGMTLLAFLNDFTFPTQMP
jgi:regulator of sigma E protease